MQQVISEVFPHGGVEVKQSGIWKTAVTVFLLIPKFYYMISPISWAHLFISPISIFFTSIPHNGNRQVRTHLLGGVGGGGENSPATRFDIFLVI